LIAFVIISCGGDTKTSKRVPIDSRDSVVVVLTGEEGKNVLELLQRGNRIEYESSSMGAFVTAINDVRNTTTHFWMYSINDTAVPMASDRMIVRSGDTIRWRFRKQGE
jgi:hypothetical protein